MCDLVKYVEHGFKKSKEILVRTKNHHNKNYLSKECGD